MMNPQDTSENFIEETQEMMSTKFFYFGVDWSYWAFPIAIGFRNWTGIPEIGITIGPMCFSFCWNGKGPTT